MAQSIWIMDMRLIVSVIPKKQSENFNMESSEIHHNESNMMFLKYKRSYITVGLIIGFNISVSKIRRR